ncbi:hypothetical protein HYU11_05360 [Candidatus Woesearchaeota archaeon]|nr:hypothetical protein [Candidatus Woesearchaeota archaeon]
MKKEAFLLLLVFFLIVGCSQQTNKGNDNFRTGTKGLVMSFIPGSPPDRFLGDGKLDVAVQVKNAGTTSIENSNGFGGNIYLTGFDRNIIAFDKEADGINLLGGRNLYDPEGEIDIKEFQGNVKLADGVDTYKTTLMATACYSYETTAAPMVCIDPDPFGSKTKQKACTTQNVGLSGGQGAPISVTKVELNPSSEKLRFTIHFSNSGGGMVYDMNSQNCNPYSTGLSSKEKNVVSVEEVRIGSIDITGTCKPLIDRKFTLINNARNIMCELDIQSSGIPQSAFSSPLLIRVRYGYTTSISKSIEIIRPPK